MNNIQQFIQSHCSNGVPFKKLGDVYEIYTEIRLTNGIWK